MFKYTFIILLIYKALLRRGVAYGESGEFENAMKDFG